MRTLKYILAVWLCFLAVGSANADLRTWRFSGDVGAVVVNGSPPAFPFPVSQGDRFSVDFTFDLATPGLDGWGSDGSRYDKAIKLVEVRVGDGTVILDPTGDCGGGSCFGFIDVYDDDPDYSDSLFFGAWGRSASGIFGIGVSLRNPGGPFPGTGPFTPFTDTKLPRTPPAPSEFRVRVGYFQTPQRTPGTVDFDGDILWIFDVDSIVDVTTPELLLSELRSQVTGVGPGKSLQSKVESVSEYYAVGDLQSACIMLSDFIQQVRAQRGKKVEATIADALVSSAEEIHQRLACD